ncbi:MAG: NAD-dependent epimerase/dehydratase family protein, partial [Candidatus Korobacteraceae bacterium]
MFLITGVAGFIGYHVANRLLNCGQQVCGIDNVNSSYSPRVKYARLERLRGRPGFEMIEANIMSEADWRIRSLRPGVVIHLAAQAGVRESLDNPQQSVDDNVVGFLKVLEFCRQAGVQHLVYASTSAVYGSNTPLPWREDDNVDNPVSLYAATKKANELMAHVYSAVHGLRTTGLRFFTVYGPYGRPDMAIFKFTRALFRQEPIQLFNHGLMSRDFTYVEDIVNGILSVTQRSGDLYKVYNIGSGVQT